MGKGIRRTLYLSPIKDKDIINFIDPLIKHYDFSSVIRELVRDGITFRKGSLNENESTKKVLQSMNPSLKNITLEPKKVSDDDISDRLDSF